MKKEHRQFAQAVLKEVRKELAKHPDRGIEVSVIKTSKDSRFGKGRYVFNFRYKLFDSSGVQSDACIETLYLVEKMYCRYKESEVSMEKFSKEFFYSYILYILEL